MASATACLPPARIGRPAPGSRSLMNEARGDSLPLIEFANDHSGLRLSRVARIFRVPLDPFAVTPHIQYP